MKIESLKYWGKSAENAFILRTSAKKQITRTPDRELLPEFLFITSYPPRECGIATYSLDLFKALNTQFRNSFYLRICALETGVSNLRYPEEVKFVVDTQDPRRFQALALQINDDPHIQVVLLQHEFGFFENEGEDLFMAFMDTVKKPVVVVFHTVLPGPDEALKNKVVHIVKAGAAVIVMTFNSAQVLEQDYGIDPDKINVIPHGTHLVPHLDKDLLKEKYGFTNKRILSTFGLLGSGKNIEITLNALPRIISRHPDTLFLIIGKTHPGVVRLEGEKYRQMLEARVHELNLQDHVEFINKYLPLEDLLEYLQLTDIYLFTSKDPNQAVSGTFAYAMSCACPIISTPIPHALEMLTEGEGIIVDFQNFKQISDGVNLLLDDDALRNSLSMNSLQKILPTAWENSAIAHARLLHRIGRQAARVDLARHNLSQNSNGTSLPAAEIPLRYRLPEINLKHVKAMTTDFGMLQFSKINQPDIDSGYTLDDNARAMIAMCMHFELTGNTEDIAAIGTYLSFIAFCQQPAGDFLNYVDFNHQFTRQNGRTNLEDSNGRAIWALGFLISKSPLLPEALIDTAKDILTRTLPGMIAIHSPRAMAFMIKGLYYANLDTLSTERSLLIGMLANRLVQMYQHESEPGWQWFESYLTYANSILPEALLCAWQDTGEPTFRRIGKISFDFLLSHTFHENGIKLISNKSWLKKGGEAQPFGEQPIDVAYTLLAIRRFYEVFQEEAYAEKIDTAFNWFLGNNHLHQIIYNPCTGGCYDGLEEHNVNLNQGAESTLSYLMARLNVEIK